MSEHRVALHSALRSYCDSCKKIGVAPRNALATAIIAFMDTSGFGAGCSMEIRQDLIVQAVNIALTSMKAADDR